MDIATVARLTRIELTPEESACYAEALGRVLEFVAALDELDLSDIEPTRHVIPIATPLRDDTVGDTLDQASALANAPAQDGEAFVVPKVV
ncbi:MAG: Asp-tRNA(Asn)/Glu-tRNA(Gln) amidotransferase subunit GatC [Myxococcota bacterium]|jgi:aspartyl-tRNA(Asn)/glutamyl-tRNA(Gln) amidotransferase subunit C|nr:Asp-tRNA(Asn)/Glu-tRNA(Gln) amidotransferase subunit GatC [Myxococcota bacterium]